MKAARIARTAPGMATADHQPTTVEVHAQRRPSGWRSGLRHTVGRWSGTNLRPIFAHLGLTAGLAVVAWTSMETVRYRWRSVIESDTHGYLEMAKSFASFQQPRWPDEFSRFNGHVWIDPALPSSLPAAAGDDDTVPHPVPHALSVSPPSAAPQAMAKYPPGWPLCLALGYRMAGLRGAMWVNPLLTIISALAMLLLTRELFGAAAAAICTFAWVTAPMHLMYMTYPLAHSADVAFTLLAFLFSTRWARSHRWGWALPAGLCAGFMPLIRPTSVIVWPALAALFAFLRREQRKSPAAPPVPTPDKSEQPRACRCTTGARRLLGPSGRPWLAAALGFSIPLLFLGIYNQRAFGNAGHTGYHFTGEDRAFDFSWISPRLNACIASTWRGLETPDAFRARWRSIWQDRSQLFNERILALCLAGLVLCGRRAALAVILMLWLIPPLLLYASYYFFVPGRVFYRFLLSGMPAAYLAIGFLFDRKCIRSPPWLQTAIRLGIAVWLIWPPLPYFKYRSAVAAHAANHATPSSHMVSSPLWLAFKQAQTPAPDHGLKFFPANTPAAIYATPPRLWQIGALRSVTPYDANAWTEWRYFEDSSARVLLNSLLPGVWGHTTRIRRIQAEMTAAGGYSAAPRLFREQVENHLSGGRKVYLCVGQLHPLHRWATDNDAWSVNRVAEYPASPGTRRLGIWEITHR